MDFDSAVAGDSRKSLSSSQKRINDQLNEEDILLMGLQRVVDSTSDKINDVGYITDDKLEQFEGQLLLEEDATFKSQTLCQKLECMSYHDVDVFAEELVDEIIDVSVGICTHIATVFDGKMSEIEIKDHIIPKIEDNITKALGKVSVFQRLPQLEEFTLDLGIAVAKRIMSQWITTEDWEYAISYVASWSDRISDFHLFKIVKIMSGQMKDKKVSLEDIDELTYMLTLGLRETNQSVFENRRRSSWLPPKKLSVDTDKLPPSAEAQRLNDQNQSTESAEDEYDDDETSEVSITDKIKCMKYGEVENFADVFVCEILDVSVDVCEKLFEVALSGEDDNLLTEIPCVCQSSLSLADSIGSGPEHSDSSMEEFSGWPTIKEFTIRGAKRKIMEFMNSWHFVEDWKYTVYYIASHSDMVSDYNLFQAMWSIPTKEYPIPQATATIFFTIEVPRVKPKFCRVDVTIQFEGSSSVYRAGQFEFMEQWLFNIIDSKLNLFKTLKF